MASLLKYKTPTDVISFNKTNRELLIYQMKAAPLLVKKVNIILAGVVQFLPLLSQFI